MKIWKIMGTLLIAALIMGCSAPTENESVTTHTVTFESNSGSAAASQQVADGTSVTEPAAPTRSGHAFDGWYSDSGLSNAWTFGSDTVNSDITLYAKWVIAYTVTFDSSSGSAAASQQVADGTAVTEPEAPTRSGFAFDGWYSDIALSNAWTFGSDTVNSDITLYAKWVIAYTVTFDSSSGSAVASQQVADGTAVTEPEAPTRSGFAFDGWYSDIALSNAWTFGSDTVDRDITLYAKWVIAYTVTFESNGGSAAASQQVADGDYAAEPEAPTRSGFAFDGWYSDTALSNAWTFGSDTVDRDITLYAKWVIAYTVTFESNGGSAAASQQVADGDYAAEPEAPTRSGFAFDGWYSDTALSNAWTFGSDTVDRDITLYAKWVIAYTVTFESNGGSAVASQQVADGDYAAEPTVPTKSGIAFDGWYSDTALSNAWTFGSDTVDRDITLYAKWVIGHTVTFESNSGSAVTSQQVADGAAVTEPEAPTRSGFAFDGWYSDSVLSNAWTFGSDTVTSDITLYAKWVPLRTVTFESNSGSAVTSQQVADGAAVTEPEAPTRSGFAFDGWYSDTALSNAWTFGSNAVTSDITLYAKWVPLRTVTFESNSGSAVTSQQVADGAYATEPTAPTRSGHTFDGWYSDTALSNAWTFGSNAVTSDITLYAKWVTIRTVTFESNSGSAVASQQVADGAYAAEPTAPTRSGHTFDGWYSDSGLSNAWTFESDTVTSDITLYAKWVTIRTVTFESNSGSAVASQQVADGAYAAEPTAPTRSGHTFDGWYSDSGLSNAWTFGSDTVTSDITLYAKWMIIYRTVTFESNSGSAVASQQVADGAYAAEPTAPTRSGFAFDGWYSDTGLSNAWTFGSNTVTSDITLYAKWAAPKIGDPGPAGGIVFYDKGSYSDGWRFLEAPPSDQGQTAWGASFGLCSDLRYGGYNDWFLPSKDNLNELYKQKDIVGGFASGDYWSSSYITSTHAWVQVFSDGRQYGNYKGDNKHVRAVRAF